MMLKREIFVRIFAFAHCFDFCFFFVIFMSIVANEKVLIDFRVDGKNPGFGPDGMTIDADGNLYVCTWGGSKILKINPK